MLSEIYKALLEELLVMKHDIEGAVEFLNDGRVKLGYARVAYLEKRLENLINEIQQQKTLQDAGQYSVTSDLGQGISPTLPVEEQAQNIVVDTTRNYNDFF